jgi:hypothetical protein
MVRLEIINQKNHSGSWSAGAYRRGQADFFFPNIRKTSIQLLLDAQQHKKYAQTTPLDDGVSYLYYFENVRENSNNSVCNQYSIVLA